MRSRRKVTEEATEVLLAAKDDAAAEASRRRSTATRDALAGEAADLLYHALVLLAERGLAPSAVIDTSCAVATAARRSLGPTATNAPPDLAPALADPDVEPLPGDRLRDELPGP